jgi:hypothetical protein
MNDETKRARDPHPSFSSERREKETEKEDRDVCSSFFVDLKAPQLGNISFFAIH